MGRKVAAMSRRRRADSWTHQCTVQREKCGYRPLHAALLHCALVGVDQRRTWRGTGKRRGRAEMMAVIWMVAHTRRREAEVREYGNETRLGRGKQGRQRAIQGRADGFSADDKQRAQPIMVGTGRTSRVRARAGRIKGAQGLRSGGDGS